MLIIILQEHWVYTASFGMTKDHEDQPKRFLAGLGTGKWFAGDESGAAIQHQ